LLPVTTSGLLPLLLTGVLPLLTRRSPLLPPPLLPDAWAAIDGDASATRSCWSLPCSPAACDCCCSCWPVLAATAAGLACIAWAAAAAYAAAISGTMPS
jgi:hypothetical protein